MLVPVAPLAPRAILPDDPGVALRLATSLLEGDRLMANHHRGLWGYTGSGRDGLGPLTIQSTGVGAASAGLVLRELIDAGLAVAVRVGSATGHSSDLTAGTTLAVSHAETGQQRFMLDETLTAQLAIRATRCGAVRSLRAHDTADVGSAEATDLETAALAKTARQADVRLAAILTISATETYALDHQALADATHAAGVIAGGALSSC